MSKRSKGCTPWLDSRTRAATVMYTSESGETVSTDFEVIVLSKVRLNNSEVLCFHAPILAALDLIQAQFHYEKGDKVRQSIVRDLTKRPDGDMSYQNQTPLYECLGDLRAAVIFLFNAIESLASDTIGQLKEDDKVIVKRRRGKVEIFRDSMIRELGIEEKLDEVIPLHRLRRNPDAITATFSSGRGGSSFSIPPSPFFSK